MALIKCATQMLKVDIVIKYILFVTYRKATLLTLKTYRFTTKRTRYSQDLTGTLVWAQSHNDKRGNFNTRWASSQIVRFEISIFRTLNTLKILENLSCHYSTYTDSSWPLDASMQGLAYMHKQYLKEVLNIVFDN